MEQRLQKILSGAGVCSRRKAEEYLAQGRVTVNGEVAQLGQRADEDTDTICFDGVNIGGKAAPVYIMLHKPRGYVTTLSDEKGRRTILNLLSGVSERVYPVGRLDMDSEGLLLLTNDGAFMQRMLHPSFEVDKVYQVWVNGDVGAGVPQLRAMTELEGESIAPAKVEWAERGVDTATLLITIHQGKNRQVRRMCSACGLEVRRLRRIQEHHLRLEGLRNGDWRHLTQQEVDGFMV